MAGLSNTLKQRLEAASRDTTNMSPADFESSPGTNGVRSRIFRFRADVAHKLLGRPSSARLEVALPAYEQLGPTNGTADDAETFNVSKTPLDNPNTQNCVVWLDGTYYGAPDNDDFLSTGTVDVTDSGTGSAVHVWYFPEAAGTIEIEKAYGGSTSSSKTLKTFSVSQLHQRNLSEQPEFFEFTDAEDALEAFIAGDMTLDVYVDVPYVTRYEDSNGDGAHATNALLNFRTLQAQSRIKGLKDAVTASM